MSASSAIALALSRHVIRQRAGPRSFERGEVYAQQGRVKRLTLSDESARATVHGTGKYRVDLRVSDDGELGWSCSCPMGADGGFCKHCVAVALVASGGATSEARDEPAVVTGALDDSPELAVLAIRHLARRWVDPPRSPSEITRDLAVHPSMAEPRQRLRALLE